MNANTTCLRVETDGKELNETSTNWTRQRVMRLLACALIGELALASLLWLGIMLVHFVRSISAPS